MKTEALTTLLKKTGVILDGHFLLTSGRHSGRFLLCSQLLQYPEQAEKVCRLIAEPFREERIDAVVGPAMGGVILAYEVARALRARALYTEKEDQGMAFKRGFRIEKGERILVVEDAVTTGGSIQKTIDCIRGEGVEPVAAAVMIDRTGGKLDLGLPTRALLTMEIESYPAADCPLCRQGLPLKRPKT